MKKNAPLFNPLETYYTTEEAGKLLGLHPETVKKKCAARLIRATKPGNAYRIPHSAIVEFLTSIQTEPVAEVSPNEIGCCQRPIRWPVYSCVAYGPSQRHGRLSLRGQPMALLC